MISCKADLSRLFRPWDSIEGLKSTPNELSNDTNNLKRDKIIKNIDSKHGTDKRNTTALGKSEKYVKNLKKIERDSRLRKVRNVSRKRKTQDDTISTTTQDEGGASVFDGNIVEHLTKFCDRLLPASRDDYSGSSQAVNGNDFVDSSLNMAPVADPMVKSQNVYYPGYLVNQHLPPGNDVLMTLGDQINMENFAQSYAFEMEYARIMSEENRLKMMNSKKQRPKKFKCPVCDVGFSNNGQLKGHIRIHNGERPFKCDEADCGKAFTRNEELTRHKRIHSGIKPYPCPTCGKKFGRRDHLKKHTRTHFVTVEKMMPMFVPYIPPYHWGIY